MKINNCICCGNKLVQSGIIWHFECKKCRYEAGELIESINSPEIHSKINEEEREKGLEHLRKDNFILIVKRLVQYGDRKFLLDVGCAHGWFLDIARNHFEVIGIEPDINVAKRALDKDLPVKIGFFPDILNKNEKFDIITFNDVIEHIPDVKKVLSDCRDHLNRNGILAINMPVSNGAIYRLSKLFYLLGVPSFFYRMWQVGFPSPHLHYFNQQNFTMLAKFYNFQLYDKKELKSFSIKGLYQRIKHTNNFGILKRFIIVVSMYILFPILHLFKSDICLLIYKIDK